MGLLGALVISVGQGCVLPEPVGDPAVSETQPAALADATKAESKPSPDDHSSKTDTPTSPVVAETGSQSLPSTEPDSARQLAPAKTLTDIEVQQQDGRVAVIVTGDGDLTYQVMRLDGNRLVVDLVEVMNGTKRQNILVGHQLIKQIRIGSHQLPQQKVRLVLDLGQSVPYTVEKTGVQVRITLSDQARKPGSLEALRPFGGEKVRKENPRQGVTAPIPERLKLLDPVTSLAQPKQGGGTPSPENGTPEPSGRYTGKRISLDFQDADISSVLRLIADVSGLNMVVGETVKAKVTLKLLNVPWDQALELILKLNQLGQLREGNILWIDTLGNIAKQQEDILKARDATFKTQPLVTRIVYLNYADAAKTVDVAKSSLSPRGEIKTDVRTNSLIVRDIEENVGKIANIVRELDRRTPQVQIEARIVQASKSFARGLGVNWGIFGPIIAQGSKQVIGISPGVVPNQLATVTTNAAGQEVFTIPTTFLVNLPATATGVSIPTSAIGLAIGRFFGTSSVLDLRLSAGESLGMSKTISAPKIITLDNKSAKIEQGSQVPFQTTSLQGTQTTFVDATLTLSVTPHVIPHANTVRLEIKTTKNAVGASVSSAGPTIDKREASSEILLQDGETAVLGGIFEEARIDNTQGIPWFNRIPFLGWLFKNEGISNVTTELLIFVTPTILKE